jgi:anti-sigma regulatory factor (Ser/Thr protein kinase)
VARTDPLPVWCCEVPGEPVAFRPAAAATAAAAVGLGVAAGRRDELTLAVHEVLVNAWEHGHLGAPEPRIHVEVARDDDGTVTIDVVDVARGGGWDPDVTPATAEPVAGRRHVDGGGHAADRGRGLLIARRLVDDVTVAAGRDGAVVTLTMRPAAVRG